jgi:hypothetical protein
MARGRYADALPLYDAQARSAGGELATEAACKAGLCLAALNRPDDAAVAFEKLLDAPGERWPAVAAANLWLIRLRQKREDDADAVARTAAARFRPDQVARFVPAAVRHEIRGQVPGLGAVGYLFPDPANVTRLESLIRVGRLLDEGGDTNRRYALAIQCAVLGRDLRAAQLAGELVTELADPAETEQGAHALPMAARLYGWLMRNSIPRADTTRLFGDILQQAARPERASASPWVRVKYPPLRLPLARLAAADEDWAGAEREVDAFLRDTDPKYVVYEFYAEGWLLKGFLLDRRGDKAGAVAAWAKGTYPAYLEFQPAEYRPRAALPSLGHSLLPHHILTSLSGTPLPDADADALWRAMAATVAADPALAQIAAGLRLDPAVIRGMWTSPRGRDLARQVAFLDLKPVDHFRTPVRVLLYETVRQGAFAGMPTRDEDEVIWQMVLSGGDLLFSRKLGKTQFLQLALAWGGTTGSLGWAGVAPKLPPEVRGAAAYVLGRKYLAAGKTADAAALFRTARSDSPPDSPARRLAAAELEKLESKK